MAWIKQNLVLVLSGVVALALLVLAGLYLVSRMAKDREVTEQVDRATRELIRLVNRDPHPGTDEMDNIAAAQAEVKEVEAFVAGMRKFFAPAPHRAELTSRDLRQLLDTTVQTLQRLAKASGVELPSDYWFSFGGIKQTLNFDQSSLQPLASQLAEVEAICHTLFDARINQLVRVKRPSTPGESASPISLDYLSEAKPSTNDWAIATPYEVTFRSFSGELGSILDSFIRSPYCIVVKNLVVDSSERSAGDGLDFDFMGRYGLESMLGTPPAYSPYGPGFPPGRGGDPYGRGFRPVPPPTAAPPRTRGGPATVIDEKLLTITLHMDVIRLKPSTPAR